MPCASRPSRAASPPSLEAGFSLVEVLAALAIASLALVMTMQVLVQSARIDARLTHETAARDLVRRLLADGSTGRGAEGVLQWQVTLQPPADGLTRRDVAVNWPGGAGVVVARVEPAP